MKIKRVKLCNFSSYAGIHEVNLDTTEDKNIILIGGNNGAGKTSLFIAIKLALYGPQCFRFQDKNNQYTAKIKSLINHDAFLSSSMHAFVELHIELPIGQRIMDYAIKREWVLQGKNLVERCTVVGNGVELEEKDLDFFHNYLFTVIPPNMFDLFFFDGEEVGEALSNSRQKQFLKDAVLTLSGFDTFGLIQKFCRSFVASEQETEEFSQVARQAETVNCRIGELEAFLDSSKALLEELNTELSLSREKHSYLEAKFSSSGGISESCLQEIEIELAKQNSIKAESSKKIRGFVESLMPVFITKDIAKQAEKQLRNEKLVHQYEEIQKILSPELMRHIIQNVMGGAFPQQEELAVGISAGISDHLRPDAASPSFQRIHDLSEEQEQRVFAIIANLNHFSPEGMISACRKRETAAVHYDNLNAKLRSALPQSDAEELNRQIEECSLLIQSLSDDVGKTEQEIEQAKQELKEQIALREKLNKVLQQQSRYQTAYMYAGRIRKIMEDMISSVTNEKRIQVAEVALKIFTQIIRKENFIHLIELDDNFHVRIYRKQSYTIEELSTLTHNIGTEALEKRLGASGIDLAIKALGIASKDEMYTYLSKKSDENQISLEGRRVLELYNRVDFSQFSKGEKQVFLLSLYWAVIKTSHQQVPFVIDTPFARIDTEHRAQISKLFFPEISSQVIILSTNEEVVGSYHQALKPFIAHEYLLEYDSESSRTNVSSGYFDEV